MLSSDSSASSRKPSYLVSSLLAFASYLRLYLNFLTLALHLCHSMYSSFVGSLSNRALKSSSLLAWKVDASYLVAARLRMYFS
jgi:hypothetical protein